jgi:hypothetical protein
MKRIIALIVIVAISSCTPIVLHTISYENVSPTEVEYVPVYIVPPTVYRDTCYYK